MRARARCYRDGRPLPVVPPRVERGRAYYTEYSWAEQRCGRRGPPWLTWGRPCSGKPNCGCSDYERLTRRMHDACGTIAEMRRAGLLRRDEMDEQITARQALSRIRPYVPYIKTTAQLFVATAWQPFKTVFERGWVGYTNFGLIAWARARAQGAPAPWEKTLPTTARWQNKAAHRAA